MAVDGGAIPAQDYHFLYDHGAAAAVISAAAALRWSKMVRLRCSAIRQRLHAPLLPPLILLSVSHRSRKTDIVSSSRSDTKMH